MKKLTDDKKLSITHPQVAAQWHPNKNSNLTPDDVSAGSSSQIIWWRCVDGTWPNGAVAEDHEWTATVNDRTNGCGCPYCSRNKVVPSNCLAVTHPEATKWWHPTKNGSMTPYDVLAGSHKRAWFVCPVAKDHEWNCTIKDAIKRHPKGCPCCRGLKTVLSNCLATTHPEVAKRWHPTKNGSLTPYDVVAGSHKCAWFVCYVAPDHEWSSSIDNIVRYHPGGCPCCKGGDMVVESNCLATTHPEVAKRWHPTKNGSLTPYDVKAGSDKYAWFICPVAPDHEWRATISNLVSCHPKGCPCCGNMKTVLSNCLAVVQPELSLEWHPNKNNLTIYEIRPGSGKKAWWICRVCHHEWQATPNSRTNGKTGCPRCKEKKGEKAITDYLSSLVMKFKPQWRQDDVGLPKRFRFDFGVERQNKFALIEHHGHQHYFPVGFGAGGDKHQMFMDNLRRDQIKEKWARDRSIPLLVIPYWDFERIPEILDQFFAGQEPTFSEPPEIVRRYEKARARILKHYETVNEQV